MTKLTDEKLDELFREKLLNTKRKTSKDGWSIIAKKVSKNNFLSFGWKHFNIYQIILASIIIISCAILYYNSTNNLNENKNSIQIKNDSTLIITKKIQENSKKLIITKTIDVKKEKNEKNIPLSKKDNGISIKKNSANTTIIAEPNDSGIEDSASSIPLPPALPKKEEPKQKKIITVIQRDTLFIKDTVSVKRKKKSK